MPSPEPNPIAHREPAVRAEIHTAAAPDRAWRAFADPRILSGWFTDRARGQAALGATMTWIFERFRMELPYEVILVEPERRLVLKGSPVGRPPYVFEVRLEPEAGGTRVRVINSGFLSAGDAQDQQGGVESGWRMALAVLREYLEHHFGRPRSSFFAMQPASFTYEQVLPYFLTEEGLSRWLTVGGRVGAPGESYALRLRDGASMSGRVLEVTAREAALTWDEINGVVELKSFLLGPRLRAVAVRGCGWDLAEERAAAIEAAMSSAIDRLVAELSD